MRESWGIGLPGLSIVATAIVADINPDAVRSMPTSEFVYTQHALDSLVLREIEREWVEQTVGSPEVCEPDPRHPERTRAYRAIPERGGRILRVVYVRDGDTIRIVTVFLDRGRRRASRAGQVRS